MESVPHLDLSDRELVGPDLTLFERAEKSGRVEKWIKKLGQVLPNQEIFSVDARAVLTSRAGQEQARVIACRCFRGAYWSLTIRRRGDSPKNSSVVSIRSNYEPNTGENPEYFTSFSKMCCELDKVTLSSPQRTGLLAVTGSTASGKSEIARGLIHMWMERAAKEAKGRKPHLITFEDPIEKYYVRESQSLTNGQPPDFDYTPREKGVDAGNLKSVLRDALRQTPTLVFVGEIRDPEEWIEVVAFAGTGHSIVATAHAGSLAEAWGKILAAVKAYDAPGRSDVADRVLAIVHLKRLPTGPYEGAFPALWRYTIPGAKALMADGRRALVPHRGTSSAGQSSFGRVWFTEQIGGRKLNRNLREAAFASDLEGL